jgi:hypothetical protein
MTRATTWSNPDGLVVGFGANTVEKVGAETQGHGVPVKTQSVVFDYRMTGVNIALPAGAQVVAVELRVGRAWVGGTTVEVGDGTDQDGFITSTAGATANLTAGASLKGTGVFFVGTGATDREFKTYASADTVDVAYTGTYTAGSATLLVSYI